MLQGLAKAVITNVAKASVEEVAGYLGLAKFTYDIGSFAYAFAVDCK